MKQCVLYLAVMLPCSLLADSFQRGSQSPGYLFNKGNYVEFGMWSISPKVDGDAPVGPTVQNSSDIYRNERSINFIYKARLNSRFDWSLEYAQSDGGEVDYFNADEMYPYKGSWAKLSGLGVTALLRYGFNDRLSVYGGPKFSTFSGNADVKVAFPLDGSSLTTVLDYVGRSETDEAFGYLLGAAYEVPDIALRISLTYHSRIKHKNDVVESASGVDISGGTGPYSIPESRSTVNTTLPDSVNLSFQTGIAPKTLLFGSVHWVNLSICEIDPMVYNQATAGSKLVSHDNDLTEYSLGLGRELNDKVSLALIYNMAEASGGQSTNLSPTDGYDSITLATTLTNGKHKTISAGISFVDVGNTFTEVGGEHSDFSDNDAIGFGISFGYKF